MLQILRRGQRWILSLVILVIGFAFVFFLGGGSFQSPFGISPQVAVAVGDRAYDYREFDRTRQALVDDYRRALGDSFDPETARDTLDQQTASRLVSRAILAAEAERLGLRVGTAELRDFLRSTPGGAGTDGRIDRDAWLQYAERDYGSVSRFEDALREDLMAQKAIRVISESIALSDAEVLDQLRYRLEEVEVAYVAVDAKKMAVKEDIPDAEVDALLASDLPRVQSAYDGRKSEFDQPEQVRARHILIAAKAAEGADPTAEEEKAIAEAKAKAEAAAARIRKGEAFEKVAEELSDDQGSKTAGGDLGFFPRGRMVPAFEAAAFSLEPGKISDPVQSTYGFHVIRVEEKRPAKLISFDEAKASLAREILAEERAKKDADELVAKLLEAVRSGKTLVEAARERSVSIERPGPIHRRGDGVIPSLGPSKEALAAIFALTPEKPTTDRAYEVSGKRVLFERTGGKLPTEAELAPNLKMARDQLLEQRRTELSNAWIETRRKELEAEGRLVYNYARNTPQE
jgi:peptidyl-prolyl cis-trans isomerase D